jgi:hypothetical protein
VRATNGADDMNLTYGVQDHDNRYLVRVDFVDSELRLYRYENATAYKLAEATTGFTLVEDVWYRVEIYWGNDGTHEASIFDSGGCLYALLTSLDTTWSDGGIGYDAYLHSGGTVYVDSVSRYEPDYSNEGSTLIIDDFEDGDLAEYSFDRGSSGANVVSSPTFSGSNALAISNTDTEMISLTGLANYPSAGDTFSYWIQATDGADDINLTYGIRDHDNRYFVRVNFANDELRLYRYDNATAYKLAETTTGFTLSQDVWYRVEVDWEASCTHTVGVFRKDGNLLARVSAKDTTCMGGGIGYDAYLHSGGTVYIDSVIMPKSKGADGNF